MIYELDGIAPTIHEDTWVAPDANLIGDVVLEEGRASGSAAPCAATTNA